MAKRLRLGGARATQLRLEAYNVFNHANLFPFTGTADLSSNSAITGYRRGNRRLQLGVRFEF
jgi:hypothetical protein